VFFLTGTDEYGSKILQKAREAGKEPRKYVDEMVVFFKELCERLNISYSRFIRTTDADHVKVSQDIFEKVYEKGDIYLGKYSGWYCNECETFYTEKGLKDGHCPTHGKKPEWLSEESYFFKMSNYTKKVLDYLEKNPKSVLPAGKRKELINRLKKGLNDLSISRVNVPWGIPLPINDKHTLYVWIGALLNYISGIDYPNSKFKKFWPADIHLIGKDIIWHHSSIFWSILLSADIPLPKTVFVHGFINTAKGDKMSKSRGTIIEPLKLAEKYNIDSVRYFLLREIPFGEDGFFSEEALVKRNNDELANDLGNLLNRTVSMVERYAQGKIPKGEMDAGLAKALDLDKIKKQMEAFELHMALGEIMAFAKKCNQFINEKKPWKLKEGKELDSVLYSLAESLRVLGLLLEPFMPGTGKKILEQIGAKKGSIEQCKFGIFKGGEQTRKGKVLFEKVK